MIIAVVGAGGKTTHIHELEEKYRNRGKRVLITTTTHMMQEAGCVLSEDAEAIRRQLTENGTCMAGNAAEDGKIGAFSADFFAKIRQEADVVLVEADGSKRLPVKAPAEHEPVIPDGCDRIDVVMGLSAIGKRLKDVAHRKERVMELTGLSEEHILTAGDLRDIIMKGYVVPLREKYPECEVRIYPGQVRTLYEQVIAEILKKEDTD